MSVVPLEIGKNNCKPGKTHRKTPFIHEMQKILRSPLREYGLKFQETGRSPLQETASPILPRAELQELQIFEIDPYGIGIQWPLLDETLLLRDY